MTSPPRATAASESDAHRRDDDWQELDGTLRRLADALEGIDELRDRWKNADMGELWSVIGVEQ